jgi:hypothetical protein
MGNETLGPRSSPETNLTQALVQVDRRSSFEYSRRSHEAGVRRCAETLEREEHL